MIKRWYRTLLLAGAALIPAMLLLRFPPEQHSFYPQCPVYAWTHLQCPGCGATRALAALLQGHLVEARRDNALVVTMLPFHAAYIVLGYWRTGPGKEPHWPQPPSWVIPSVVIAAAVFTVVRNLPA